MWQFEKTECSSKTINASLWNALHYGVYTMYARGQVAPSMLASWQLTCLDCHMAIRPRSIWHEHKKGQFLSHDSDS
jgi:hypothetical protein